MSQNWEETIENGGCFEFEEWDIDKNSITDIEGEMVRALCNKILPRHMPYFDCNLPFAQASIIAIRPFIKQIRQQDMEELIKNIENLIQKERFAGAPYALSQVQELIKKYYK